jgi:hypothetical protein
VVGVNANVLSDGGYPPNFIPSFTWAGRNTYDIEKALSTAERAMSRRNMTMSDDDRAILKEVFRATAGDREWERSQGR